MDTEQPSTVAVLLKRYRMTAGLTQEALAERAGLSREAISALERGERQTPRKDTGSPALPMHGGYATSRAAVRTRHCLFRDGQIGLPAPPDVA